jgi:hypothetical protein
MLCATLLELLSCKLGQTPFVKRSFTLTSAQTLHIYLEATPVSFLSLLHNSHLTFLVPRRAHYSLPIIMLIWSIFITSIALANYNAAFQRDISHVPL